MTPEKRLSDILFALIATVVFLPVMLVAALAIVLVDGRPILYISDRAKAPGQIFRLVKFRTMRPGNDDSTASGGHKNHRISPLGAFLRRARIDEMPQLWNILKGDMSFVGPRPPLPYYVEQFPEIYAKVLQARPGLTGVASIYFHAHEDFLLRKCTTQEENERVYRTRCIPRKAQLDLMYVRNWSLCWDFRLILAAAFPRLR